MYFKQTLKLKWLHLESIGYVLNDGFVSYMVLIENLSRNLPRNIESPILSRKMDARSSYYRRFN